MCPPAAPLIVHHLNKTPAKLRVLHLFPVICLLVMPALILFAVFGQIYEPFATAHTAFELTPSSFRGPPPPSATPSTGP